MSNGPVMPEKNSSHGLSAVSGRAFPAPFFFRDAALPDGDKAEGCSHKTQSVHVRLRPLLMATSYFFARND